MARKPRLFDVLKILVLAVAWLTQWDLNADDFRIPVEATINGQRVHLIFDTGAEQLILFKRTADRLKLNLTPPSTDRRPSPGRVVAGWTEPCDFVFQTITARVEFAVFDVPPQVLTEVEGMLPWQPFSDGILVIDAENQSLKFAKAVPEYARNWLRFDLLTNSRVLGFRIPGADPAHNCVYADTGSPDGVELDNTLWKQWEPTQADVPFTMDASYSPATGVTVSTQRWAKALTLGPLTVTHVPVEEVVAAYTIALLPNHLATLGMYALLRLNLIVDGSNGVVYAKASEKSPPPFAHNRAGVVFVPQDVQKDGPLLAQVVPGGPAFRAGIRDGDVLLKVNGLDFTKWFTDPQSKPNTRFSERPAGTMLTLSLKRGDREFLAMVVLKDILGPDPSKSSQ